MRVSALAQLEPHVSLAAKQRVVRQYQRVVGKDYCTVGMWGCGMVSLQYGVMCRGRAEGLHVVSYTTDDGYLLSAYRRVRTV